MPVRAAILATAALSALAAGPAPADTPLAGGVLAFEPAAEPATISQDKAVDKVRNVRTPDGTLFAVYGEAQDVDIGGGSLAYDPQARVTRKPFDIVLRYSLDDGETWSAAINLSNTAALSSAPGMLEATGLPPLAPDGHPDLAADPRALPYPGDTDKSNIFNVGNNILVTWGGKYCAGDQQRFLVYPELGGVTVPYSCLYAARLSWDSTNRRLKTTWPGGLPYLTQQLTSGLRDVKQDVNRGNAHAWVISWQEDPLGLKLGEAEGPGDGASGANVNAGTDIWYAYLPASQFAAGAWAVQHVSRNTTASAPLDAAAKPLHPAGSYDTGVTAASRPALGQIEQSVVIAYEETKGGGSHGGAGGGKYVRYHHFAYDAPPAGGEAGCIVSDPLEHARRARLVTQASTEDVPLLLFYRQGTATEGGPADILLRRAVGGFTDADLAPGVDAANCHASVSNGEDPKALIGAAHAAALNISGSGFYGLPSGTALDAATGANALENAIAHRAILRGDSVLVGYSYTPYLEQFEELDDEAPYNFYVRRSDDGGATWEDARNMTPEVTPATGLTVREPRLIGMPGDGPKCATDPRDCRNEDVLYIAYGTATNVAGGWLAGGEEDVDIYMRVSQDNGRHWSPTQALTAGNALGQLPDAMEDFETQLKARPDGRVTYTVWSGNDGTGARALFRRGVLLGDRHELTALDGSPTVLEVLPAAGEPGAIGVAAWVPDDNPGSQPQLYEFPFGRLVFTVTHVAPGATVAVHVQLPPAESLEYWNRGGGTAWQHFAGPSASVLSFELTDGGSGDADGSVDGVIVHSGSVGIAAPPAVPDGGGTGLRLLALLALAGALRRAFDSARG